MSVKYAGRKATRYTERKKKNEVNGTLLFIRKEFG